MIDLDLDFVRAQFPAFSDPALEGFAYFENAGGSYACGQVIERLGRFYRENKLQPYYPSAPSIRAGEQMDQSKQRLAEWLGIAVDELHFGPSTSANTYVLAQALRQALQPGDEIVVTQQDHEANVGAWWRLQESGIVVREWAVDSATGELAPAGLEALLGPRTKVVAFTHCSNVVGTIHPVRRLTDLVHQAGAWAIVDGVALSPHGLPDLAELGADIYLFSLYKVYGPHLGAFYMRRSLNEAWPNQGHFFNAEKPSARFTPAGPDHAQIAAVGGVTDYLEAVARRHGFGDEPLPMRAASVARLFRRHETGLLQPLLDYLANHPRVRLLGGESAAERAPTVAFTVAGQRPRDLATRLAESKLGVGCGHFYAYRLLQALGIDTDEGVLRISFVHYTSQDEVGRVIAALDRLLQE
ncbi:MAG: aminotransferase class V-fold PLP-dependent enzyme [Gammaproteobacteria bacterium]|nr:aminotransferase class V-fold PLP-dependent enzyme [Gammaproteobacteria bacterium]